MTAPLFPEPPAREAKPSYAQVPPVIIEQIERIAGDKILSAETVFGGLSSSAGYALTLQRGGKIFAKGSHPEEMAHGAENLRHEIASYLSIPALQKIAPGYIGFVEEGDDNGWKIGLWEYIHANRSTFSLAVIEDFPTWQQQDKWQGAIDASSHNYLAQFFNADRKWRRIEAEEKTRKKFLSIFADPKAGETWLTENISGVCALQDDIIRLDVACGLIHGDLRADNFIFSGERHYIVDWPNACYGPLIFDPVFLSANLHGLGVLPMDDFFARLPHKFSRKDLAVMMAVLAGYFADQIYRDVPPRLPRLRWMQKLMFAALMHTLATWGFVDSMPIMKDEIRLTP